MPLWDMQSEGASRTLWLANERLMQYNIETIRPAANGKWQWECIVSQLCGTAVLVQQYELNTVLEFYSTTQP